MQKDHKLVQEYIIAGVQKMLAIQMNIKTSISSASDFSDAFKKIPADKRGNVLSFIRLSSIEFNTIDSTGTLTSVRPHAISNGYGADVIGALGARARYAQVGDQRLMDNQKNHISPNKVPTETLVAGFVPALFTFDLSYFSKSLTDVLEFGSRWAFAQTHSRLNFNLEYAGTQLPIQIALSNSLSIPEKSNLGEDASYYQFEGQITVSGVLSSSDIRDTYTAPVIHYDSVEIQTMEAQNE